MSSLKLLSCSIIILLCLISELSIAQRNNHVVLNDTVFSEGFVKHDEENLGYSVYFKRSRQDPWKKYSIEEVNEYYLSRTKYLRKNLPSGYGGPIFLEQMPAELKGYLLLKSIESDDDIYLESDNGIQKLGGDFKEVLSSVVNNPDLDPLLAITKFEPYNIAYFLTRAGTYQKPRTYTKATSVSFFAGLGSASNRISIPFTNAIPTIKGTSRYVGFLVEMALNTNRNFALTSGLTLMKVTSQDFLRFRDSDIVFETDASLDYMLLQIPIQFRYYADLRPNSLRGYVELGYGFSFLNSSTIYLNVAELDGQEALTYRSEFELTGSFHGIVGGLGLEKVLPKSRAIFLGMKFFNHGSERKEIFSGATGTLGFKF